MGRRLYWLQLNGSVFHKAVLHRDRVGDIVAVGFPTAVNKYHIISYVVFFLLGDSPASEFHVPKFRNPMFHLHRRCGQEEQLGGDC